MSDERETFRHGLAAGGLAMLAGTGLLLFAFDAPTDPESLLSIGWIGLVGVALLAAGLRERISLGPVSVGWNRLAAFGMGSAALVLGAGGVASVLDGGVGLGDVWSLGLLVVSPYFAWLAFECWVGGRRMDRETFAVE